MAASTMLASVQCRRAIVIEAATGSTAATVQQRRRLCKRCGFEVFKRSYLCSCVDDCGPCVHALPITVNS